jgi:serine/threonine protein kinase
VGLSGTAPLQALPPAPGSASAMITTPSPTLPGVVLGTVGYMAPEKVRGLAVDHRADLFALGAILYELLSGVRVSSRHVAGDDGGDPQRGSAGSQRGCDSDPAGPRADRQSLPGEESVGAISDSQRSCLCTGPLQDSERRGVRAGLVPAHTDASHGWTCFGPSGRFARSICSAARFDNGREKRKPWA